MSVSSCLSACLSVCLSVCLSTYLSLCIYFPSDLTAFALFKYGAIHKRRPNLGGGGWSAKSGQTRTGGGGGVSPKWTSTI